MAKKVKSKVKQIEEQDEFLKFLSEALEFVKKHRVIVGVSFIALVLIMIVSGIWIQYNSKYKKEAALRFSEAFQCYKNASHKTKGDIKKCLSLFEDVADNYARSLYSSISHLYIARCYEELGDIKRAKDEYRKSLQLIKDDLPFKPAWQVSFAILLGPDEGIKILKKLKEKNTLLKPYIRFSLALLYQERGDLKVAYQELHELRRKFPTSRFSEEAKMIEELLK